MGESQQEQLSLDFDARVRLEFVGSNITSDAGLLAYRELDEKLGLTEMAGQFLTEQRTGCNVQHQLVPLVRQSVYSRLAGYPDTNDSDRLARDPTTWDRPRRVVAKIEWHAGELFPRIGFTVTNRTDRAKGVVRFYDGRCACEQWIKEGKYAVEWMRLSCHQFKDNAVRLALFVLAYNLGNFLRRLALPKEMAQWSLTTLREKLVKVGARLTRHARRLVVQMADVAVT